MAVIQTGSSSTGVANVDAGYNLNVALSNTPAYVGSVRMFSENDPGDITGEPTLRSPETSQDYRMRVGVDTLLFTDTFNATAQNTSNWKYVFTTMTMTQSAGFLNINAAGTSTVANNSAFLQSRRYFPLLGTAPLSVEFTGQITAYPGANEIFLAGLGVAVAADEPVDGCWWELSSNGLNGVIRYNSGVTSKTELVSAANLSTMSLNTNAKYVMVVGERGIDWWIDDVLYGTTELPSANGQPFMTTALPVFLQKYNSGTVGGSPNMVIKVGDVSVLLSDLNANQAWANQMASCGLGLQGQNGGTMGSSQIQWANTALPAAGAATNTTAALGAFLGGIFQMNAPATSATDVIIASWLNPVGGVNQTPRTIKLRGIKIDCVNSVAAVAVTATTFAVALAWGATALSLATAESGSFVNNTAKARRIQPLGVISFPILSPVGTAATPIQFDFEAPIVVNPGEYLQVVAKILVGTATATEVFQWIISPNLYHE
jgi:hypothetical protein